MKPVWPKQSKEKLASGEFRWEEDTGMLKWPGIGEAGHRPAMIPPYVESDLPPGSKCFAACKNETLARMHRLFLRIAQSAAAIPEDLRVNAIAVQELVIDTFRNLLDGNHESAVGDAFVAGEMLGILKMRERWELSVRKHRNSIDPATKSRGPRPESIASAIKNTADWEQMSLTRLTARVQKTIRSASHASVKKARQRLKKLGQ